MAEPNDRSEWSYISFDVEDVMCLLSSGHWHFHVVELFVGVFFVMLSVNFSCTWLLFNKIMLPFKEKK